MEKNCTLTLDDNEKLALMCKALSSEVRIKILKLLCTYRLNINEIAERLEIPASSAAMNVKILEEAGMIATELQAGVRGSAKICYKTLANLNIGLETEQESEKIEIISMPIGNYVDYKVEATCGLVSSKGYIGEEDEPRAFYDPERTKTKLLWLNNGYVEYRFPNHMIDKASIKAIEISAELCSEDHEYNLDCPSDITLWVDGIAAGTWTCPSDFGGRRGKLNPEWWPDKSTQYGVLKTWKITDRGTYLDHEKINEMGLKEYQLDAGGYISVRLGNAEDAENKRGMNIFGDCFGDYPQNIVMKIIFNE